MASLKDLRVRISSVKSTQRITSAMKMVAAAKLRRAQDLAQESRPYAERMERMLASVSASAASMAGAPALLVGNGKDDTHLIIVMSSDRGLCGGFNNFIIKKAEERVAELKTQGVAAKLVTIGKKGSVYFKRRKDQYDLVKTFDMGQAPKTEEAQAIADEVYSEFVGEEVDKVELVYSRFVSLINSDPSIQTLLPLSKEGEICDVNGTCVDAQNDIIFSLTTEDGKFAVKGEPVETEVAGFEGVMQFEQDPNQILDALLPLYMNSQILRALQESLASELAARMNAMSNASDNAKDLSKRLTLEYNRKRQAKITAEIIELVAGASAA